MRETQRWYWVRPVSSEWCCDMFYSETMCFRLKSSLELLNLEIKVVLRGRQEQQLHRCNYPLNNFSLSHVLIVFSAEQEVNSSLTYIDFFSSHVLNKTWWKLIIGPACVRHQFKVSKRRWHLFGCLLNTAGSLFCTVNVPSPFKGWLMVLIQTWSLNMNSDQRNRFHSHLLEILRRKI